jgi:hypothetical protein
MNYLAIALNHFKAIQVWLRTANAEATLDLASFELEVRCRQRYYRLFPQFIAQKDGRFIYAPVLSNDSIGFIGWLPYRSISWSLSNDKLVFKKFLAQQSERTPRSWITPDQPACDYIIKRSMGSFGDDLAGPFHAEAPPASTTFSSVAGSRGIPFAEEFIQGEILKVWFWGSHAFYAQRRKYPAVTGDGSSTLRKLLEAQLALSGKSLSSDDPDHATLISVLHYQQKDLNAIPAKGERIWLDYRYGRNYARSGLRTTTDNALPNMTPRLTEQIDRLGGSLATELDRQFSAPVLFSLDAVIDVNEQIWWLEANSNPTLPPDGYPTIFSTLFGTPMDTTSEPTFGIDAPIVA